MNLPDYEERLADYLAGELDADARADFEAELRKDPTAQAEVSELRATLVALRGLPSAGTAVRAAVRAPWQRYVVATLKAAAVLAFGVLIGRMTAGGSPGAPPPEAPGATPAPRVQIASIHPGWIEIGRKLGAGSSSFGAPLGLTVQQPQ